MKLGKYKHFKGHLVRVIAIAKHSETEEEFVVYEHLLENGEVRDMWIRPKKMFEEMVEKDGKRIKRFTYIGNK